MDRASIDEKGKRVVHAPYLEDQREDEEEDAVGDIDLPVSGIIVDFLPLRWISLLLLLGGSVISERLMNNLSVGFFPFTRICDLLPDRVRFLLLLLKLPGRWMSTI